MFKSKLRPIVIPQSEHGNLAGTLALLWGNANFDQPAIEPLSLVAGIGFHDRGYGVLDPFPLGELVEEDWLRLTRRGFYTPCADPVADIITKLHLKRLVSLDGSAARQALLLEMERVIDNQLSRHSLSREVFERVDRLTNFCDRVSFDFCFEQPAHGEVSLFPKNDGDEQIVVRYAIEAGAIKITPWPFSIDSYTHYLVGYHLKGYPGEADPIVVPYRLVKDEQV